MAQRHPVFVRRLFQPMPTDRRGEVPEGKRPWFETPIYNDHLSLLSAIYAPHYVRSSQRFPDAPRLNAEDIAALALCRPPMPSAAAAWRSATATASSAKGPGCTRHWNRPSSRYRWSAVTPTLSSREAERRRDLGHMFAPSNEVASSLRKAICSHVLGATDRGNWFCCQLRETGSPG
jgi:hypothetical protein